MVAAVVGGVAGLATGALASVVAPWVNWGIERRRLRLERRQELIAEWRTGLAEAEEAGLFGGRGGYLHLPWYQSLTASIRNNGRAKRWLTKHAKKAWYSITKKTPRRPCHDLR